ncbi:MAG: hypothetical protein L3J59_16380 [Methylococcaceae bacterium]|nr:hypothetical protein [Methylococcaceae bacterium]
MTDKIDIKAALPEYNDLLQAIPLEIEEILLDIESHPNVNLNTLNINYALLFELDYKVLASLFLVVFSDNLPFDLKDEKEVNKLLLSPKELPDKLLSSLEEDISNDEDFGKNEALLLLSFFLNVMLALQSNIKAISVYGHTKSICELIAKARDDEDLKALFDAIAIDKTCLNTPTAQKAVYHATITGDNNFFDKLSRAIKGSRPKNQKAELDIVRYMDALIQSWTNAKPLTNEEICHIFIDQLGIYPDTGEDSHAGLTRLLQRLRKSHKTT